MIYLDNKSSFRDPIDLFTSLWDYAKLGAHYRMSLERYALSDKNGRLADRNRLMMRHVGRNQGPDSDGKFWPFGRSFIKSSLFNQEWI